MEKFDTPEIITPKSVVVTDLFCLDKQRILSLYRLVYCFLQNYYCLGVSKR